MTLPTIKVTGSIEFAYRDSGPPNEHAEYRTVILIHGHTYHSGTFKHMFEQAKQFGFRIIIPNRRLYPGSTPYTMEEADALGPTHSTEDLTNAYMKQGEYLLLFVSNVIEEYKLKHVILAGWSLGTGFLNATVASISEVSSDIQSRIRGSIKAIVWWDPPAAPNGITKPPTGAWHPLYTEEGSLTAEERSVLFQNWLTQYYPHEDIDKKECDRLIYRLTSPGQVQATFTGISLDELQSMIDSTAGENGDNHLGAEHFQPVNGIIRGRALFDSRIRSMWGDCPFNVIYGDNSPYSIVWAVWMLEEQAERTGLPIAFKVMRGANHFAMHDHTKLVFETFSTCYN